MVRMVNRLIINALILCFLGVLAFVYYDVNHRKDNLAFEKQTLKTNVAEQADVEIDAERLEAGTIQTLQGQVTVKAASGEEKIVASGDTIAVGDIIQTGQQAKTQIQFSDKSQITLYPDTQLKIIDYSFVEGKAGINIARLLKGQLRAVSGLIGKRNGDQYQMRSHVATIGIRGTEYVLRFCYKDECQANGTAMNPGLYMGVIDGEIIASSDAGETIIKKGELFYQLRNDQPAEKMDLLPGLLIDGDAMAAAVPKQDIRQWILEKVKR